MTCDGKELAKILAVLDVVVQTDALESSGIFRLRCGRGVLQVALAGEIYGEISLPAEVDSKAWETYVDRKLFRKFVEGSGDKLTFKFEPEQLTVKMGKRTARYKSRDLISGYGSPSTAQGKPLNLTAEMIREIEVASRYITTDQDSPEYGSVLIRSGRLFAANRLSYFSAAIDLPDATIPGLFVKLLDSGPFRVSKLGAMFVYPTGYLFHPLRDVFPVDAVSRGFEMAKDWKTRIVFRRDDILEPLIRLKKLDSSGTLGIHKEGGSKEATLRVVEDSAEFEEIIPTAAIAGKVDEELLIPSIVPFLQASPPDRPISISFEDKSPFLLTIKGMDRRLLSPRRKSHG